MTNIDCGFKVKEEEERERGCLIVTLGKRRPTLPKHLTSLPRARSPESAQHWEVSDSPPNIGGEDTAQMNDRHRKWVLPGVSGSGYAFRTSLSFHKQDELLRTLSNQAEKANGTWGFGYQHI